MLLYERCRGRQYEKEKDEDRARKKEKARESEKRENVTERKIMRKRKNVLNFPHLYYYYLANSSRNVWCYLINQLHYIHFE